MGKKNEIETIKNIEKRTNEFVLEQINKNYKNCEEDVLCELLNAMGYETKIIKNREGEKDIIASKPGTSLNILTATQLNLHISFFLYYLKRTVCLFALPSYQ